VGAGAAGHAECSTLDRVAATNAARLRRAALTAVVLVAPAAALGAPACSFGVANALSFGTYDPLAAAPLDSQSTLSYRCPRGMRVRISLDSGLAGAFGAREMRMGTERLLYNLYLDAPRTAVWGDGTGGSGVGPAVIVQGASGTTTAYVFGRIPAAQDAAAGLYSDVVRVTFEL
jgi:spore coat protein U-like protein